LYKIYICKNYKYHYIYTPDGFVAIMKQIGTTKTMQYVAKDHLGSVMALYDTTRTLIEEFSYDAWGRRRNPTNWTYTSVPTATNTRHGFTGHEHLDKYALINMNGRVYDPVTGRFLSPDPVLQDPANAQNYNKYSYVLNNPLKYTDPSGNVITGGVTLNFAPDVKGVSRRMSMASERAWQEMKAQVGSGNQTGSLMLMLLGLGGIDPFGTSGGGGGAAPAGGDCESNSSGAGDNPFNHIKGEFNYITSDFNYYKALHIADSKTRKMIEIKEATDIFNLDEMIDFGIVTTGGLIGLKFTYLGTMTFSFSVCYEANLIMGGITNDRYNSYGNNEGIYAINVSSPGALTRAALFLASDNSFLDWYDSPIDGAPTIPYYCYQNFLNGLNH
jgi:RHS repeat-associated protein